MKTGNQYRASLKKLEPNLYKWGKPIKDVTRNPAIGDAKSLVIHPASTSHPQLTPE